MFFISQSFFYKICCNINILKKLITLVNNINNILKNLRNVNEIECQQNCTLPIKLILQKIT